MFRNYLKSAIRSLLKQRIYTLINLLGLSVSVAACLLITLYLKYEFSYDQFHEKGDRIYKMALERIYPEHRTFYSIIPHSFAEVMVEDFPEIEATIKLGGPNDDVLVTYRKSDTEIITFEEDYFMMADSNFFSIFSIPLLKGDPNTVLKGANKIVLTEDMAKRYFGTEEPIGKTLNTDQGDFQVTGVCANVPDNSHFKFDFLGSLSSFNFFRRENFRSFSAHVYLLLKPGADYKALEQKFPAMVDRYAAAQIERELKQSWADYTKSGNGYRYFLQPLTSIHLDPTNIEAAARPGGNITYVYILSGIAILVLVIACINFMNLATARSADRAREVGVRKTMGSHRQQLIFQFLTEAILLAFVGMIIAIIIVELVLPGFSNLAEKPLKLIFTPDVIGGIVGFALLVGILAGLYPAFVLSSYNPVVVMKGNFTGSSSGNWLRNGLVVFQFTISIVLIVCTMIVQQQLTYIQSKSLGYDKNHVLIIERSFALRERFASFVDEVRVLPNILSAGATSAMLGRSRDFFGQTFQQEGSLEVLTSKSLLTDDDYVSTMGLEIVDGRGFSKETNDSLAIILNEKAVQTFGMKDPVGAKLSSSPFGGDERMFTVVGVVKDFNFQTLKDPITPLVLLNIEIGGRNNGSQYIAVRLEGDNLQRTVESIESKWKQFVPTDPFKFVFLDDNIQAQYMFEVRTGKIFGVFSGLAIVIACVGLFGLSAYTASRRTKEIGIRKVMGASIGGVVVLLSKDFTRLVIIAFVLASPLAWWMMNLWLGGFAYRISVGAASFVIAGLAAFLIAGLTVSYQSIKAARLNPVDCLRSE